MAIGRLTIPALAVAAAALVAVAAATSLSVAGGLHEALEALAADDLAGAEETALDVARSDGAGAGRAWVIVAAARQRAGEFAQAQRAYRQFLTACTDSGQQAYAVEQIAWCRSRAEAAPEAPGLTAVQRERFGAVSRGRVFTESSEHFVVRARNSELARHVAAQAERALERICRTVLSGQEYPHSVQIYIWPRIAQYRKHATSAAEWAGGSFSLRRKADGQAIRRIDLTQLDENGLFDASILSRVLPHEMCHLVVTESFGDAVCPLALDEGMAMLAEESPGNSRILLAGAALAGDQKIPLETLLVMDRCNGDNAAAFYAEAFSLTEYLHSRMTGCQFREMLDHLRAGCSVEEAAQRALYVPGDETFLPRLARAWEGEAIKQAQFLRALEETAQGGE